MGDFNMKHSKRFIAGVLALLIVFSGVYLGNNKSLEAQAANISGDRIEQSDYVAISYNQVNLGTVPTPKSAEYKEWLFAGWFTGEGCSEESALSQTDTPDESCYAKFVPSDLLAVKVQTINQPVHDRNVYAPNGMIRFVSSVDSLDYRNVGFEITDSKGTVTKHTTGTVYSTIDSSVKDSSTQQTISYEFDPIIMDIKSEYFITVKLAAESADEDYTVCQW